MLPPSLESPTSPFLESIHLKDLKEKESLANASSQRLAAMPEYLDLIRRKKRFVIPATLFFMAYYFALPILTGFFPELMKKKIIGPLNGAYLFALSQFFMAWILAALYIRAAGKWDQLIHKILRRFP